jgi:hypothetical protein
MTTRLPIVGSTAKSTAFVSERLDGPGELHIFLDGNGKITADNGTLAAPRPNAFSLVEGADCPYRTPTCEAACYVHGLKAAAPDLHEMYEHNSRTIRAIVDGSSRRARDWARVRRAGAAARGPAAQRGAQQDKRRGDDRDGGHRGGHAAQPAAGAAPAVPVPV